MGEPYWRYGGGGVGSAAHPPPLLPSSADRVAYTGSIHPPSFPGYLSSEAAILPTRKPYSSNGLQGSFSDFTQKDILPSRPGVYGIDDTAGVRHESGLNGSMSRASIKPYPSLEDPNLLGHPRVAAPRISPGIPDATNERPNSVRRVESNQVPAGESNILFVDGLPNDCTRREIGHLFRPFIGFRELRVVHKEPRRTGDKAMVLCFVEFSDAKCALTAKEALQGYKFDDKKAESPVLRISFAHFPFSLPSDLDRQQLGA
ncbi:RNA-binding protein 1-like isoform X1 [Olea europaea var. sylvestris]|uniref:RNA-binding protein 1-like isoform X1 n=1 Tax=Olea europaea var. sylvestris TaxID=158386 RepID=UPI000C1CFE2B|nr:RNA-binding protein 1-like isoform X1 [Olea europaea var. sylvestris]